MRKTTSKPFACRRGAPLGSSRRILYAGGGSAIHRQRQKCEPGSHPLEVRGFALRFAAKWDRWGDCGLGRALKAAGSCCRATRLQRHDRQIAIARHRLGACRDRIDVDGLEAFDITCLGKRHQLGQIRPKPRMRWRLSPKSDIGHNDLACDRTRRHYSQNQDLGITASEATQPCPSDHVLGLDPAMPGCRVR